MSAVFGYFSVALERTSDWPKHIGISESVVPDQPAKLLCAPIAQGGDVRETCTYKTQDLHS